METRIPGMPFLPGTVFKDVSRKNMVEISYNKISLAVKKRFPENSILYDVRWCGHA